MCIFACSENDTNDTSQSDDVAVPIEAFVSGRVPLARTNEHGGIRVEVRTVLNRPSPIGMAGFDCPSPCVRDDSSGTDQMVTIRFAQPGYTEADQTVGVQIGQETELELMLFCNRCRNDCRDCWVFRGV